MSAVLLDLDAEAVVPALLELQFDCFLDDLSEESNAPICTFPGDDLLVYGESPSGNGKPENQSQPLCWDIPSDPPVATGTKVEDDPNHEQEAHNQVRATQNLPVPKIMKNDIRRYFARMFMNTINSAELSKIQCYFNTFMVGPCMFVAQHQVRPELRVPDKMVTAGPWLMSHYLLGCFVQYPDMVLQLKNSRIVTHPGGVGSRIVMEMEVRGTKIHDLDIADWIPQVAQLHQICAAAAPAEKKRRNAPATKSLTAVGAQEFSVPSAERTGVEECPTKELMSVTTTLAPAAASQHKATKRAAAGAKRGRKAIPDVHIDIPEAYIHSLFAKARLLAEPIDMVLGGTLTLFLDESNHMQHMSLDMKQIN